MTDQSTNDVLGNLRGLLYDWKSEGLIDSTSSFIQYANKIFINLVLCVECGYSEVLEGIDFYNDWLSSDHKQLCKFLKELQSLWDWYNDLSPDECVKYDSSDKKFTIQLFSGCTFTLKHYNTLLCDSPRQVIIDLWKKEIQHGIATVRLRNAIASDDNSYYEITCGTLLPTPSQEVSTYAVAELLSLFPSKQQTNNKA